MSEARPVLQVVLFALPIVGAVAAAIVGAISTGTLIILLAGYAVVVRPLARQLERWRRLPGRQDDRG